MNVSIVRRFTKLPMNTHHLFTHQTVEAKKQTNKMMRNIMYALDGTRIVLVDCSMVCEVRPTC